MPNYYRFEQQFFTYLSNIERNVKSSPIYLGYGSGGGASIIGTLPQTRVSYDVLEEATNTTHTSSSLMDNLNHIRYDIVTLQDAYASGAGVPSGGGLTQGHYIYDDTVELTQREKLVILGSGITVVDNLSNDSTDLTINNPSLLDLTDTPSSYITESGKVLKVNGLETGVIFADAPYAGNTIVRYDSSGTFAEEYSVNESGLRGALDGATSGDVVLLPPQTITVTSDGVYGGSGCIKIREGVTLRGMSREHSIITANISTASSISRVLVWMENDSILDNLTINYTRDNEDDVYGIASVGDDDIAIGGIYNTTLIVNNLYNGVDAPLTMGIYVFVKYDPTYIRTIIDNCLFMVYGGAAGNYIKSEWSDEGTVQDILIIKDSVFFAEDTVNAYTNGYSSALEFNNYYEFRRAIVDNCRFYAYTSGDYTTEMNAGFSGRGTFDVKDCYSLCESTGTQNNVRNFAFRVEWSIADPPSTIINCIGIASNESSLVDSNSYYVAGLLTKNAIVIGGYFKATNSLGDAWGLMQNSIYTTHAGISNVYNTVFIGTKADIRLATSSYGLNVYNCQYDTISNPGGGTITLLQGDRAGYEPEGFHSSDIENDVLTRHLPLPTISGYMPVADGTKWVLDSGAGFTTFKALNDTPPDYIGMAEKVVIVNDMENGLEFVTLSGLPPSGPDQKVKVSVNDLQESYLYNKLVAGSGVSIVELNDGDFETLELGMTSFGMSGNKILLYHNNGSNVGEYDADETGLKDALSASTSGDTVLLPPQTITIAIDGLSDWVDTINIPEGVTLKGIHRDDSKLVATISDSTSSKRYLIHTDNESVLDNFTIEYTRSNATNEVCTIYKSDVDSEGIRLLNLTVFTKNLYDGATSYLETYALYIKIRNYDDSDNIAIDNCIFKTEGADPFHHIITDSSSSYKGITYIRNSEFTTYDPELHTCVSTRHYPLYVYGTYGNKVVIDNCNINSMRASGVGATSSALVTGIYAVGNVDVKNCKAIINNPASCTNSKSAGIYVNNTESLRSEVSNCTFLVTSNSTSDTYNYQSNGLQLINDIFVRDCYAEVIDTNTGLSTGVYLGGGTYYLSDSTFIGGTRDIFIAWESTLDIYGCQYSTVEHKDEEVWDEAPNQLRGDRSTFNIDNYHASDIASGIPIRHLPLPTVSGLTLISDGDRWVQASGLGTFQQLVDTPTDYIGQADKVLIVNTGETGIQFTDGGTGNMLKSIYDIDENGIVDQAEGAPWDGITGKPSVYPPSTHNHDDRYYKKTILDIKFQEVDEFLDMDDTPTTYSESAGKVVVVNDTEDELEFVDVVGVGGGVTLEGIGARVYSYDNTSVPTNSYTYIPFPEERWDTDNIHSNVTNNSRLTCKTAGKYIIMGSVTYNNIASIPASYKESRSLLIKVNRDLDPIARATNHDFEESYKTYPNLDVSTIWELEVGDYVELVAFQTSGTTIPILSTGDTSPEFMMQLVEIGDNANFLALEDTPDDYIGRAGQGFVVASGETGLEFVTMSGVGDMLKSIYDTNDDGIVNAADVVTWSGVSGKPSTYPPDSHDHDERYYTETEINTKLALQDEFTELTDSPSSYVGEGNKVIAVKDTEDGLEFVVQSGAGSGAGASTFIELTDVPSSYTGEAGKYTVVKDTEDGLEFAVGTGSGSGASDLLDLDDTPVTYSGESGKSLVVNDEEDGVEFVTVSGVQDIGAKVYNNASLSIDSNTDTEVTYNSEEYDTDTMHSTVTNTGRLTCKTAGKYLVIYTWTWASTAAQGFIMAIYKNGKTSGTKIGQHFDTVGEVRTASLMSIVALDVDDYVNSYAWQYSSGAKDLNYEAAYSPYLSIQKMG